MSVYSEGERRLAVHLAAQHGAPEAARRTGASVKAIYGWARRMGVETANGTRSPALRSGRDVAHQAGVTYRRVDYLARTGVVAPARPGSGSGHSRHYTGDDVAAVRVACHLADLGMTPAALAPLDRPTRARLLAAMQRALDPERQTERQTCGDGVESSASTGGPTVPTGPRP